MLGRCRIPPTKNQGRVSLTCAVPGALQSYSNFAVHNSPPFSGYTSLTDPPLFTEQNFDYSQRTVDVYGVKLTDEPNFYGYTDAREKMDYSFHVNFTQPRQLLHNKVLEYTLSPGTSFKDPWIVFTAGAMGSGKTHTIKSLAQLGYFPWDQFILISPDRLKRFLPEFQGYLQYEQATVGLKLRKEVGYMSEMILWESIFNNNCIWFDSSLREGAYFLKLFQQIRREYPQYRIAVIYVKANDDVIFKRAAERAKMTLRVVPEEAIRQSIDEVPRSMDILKPLTDFYTEIDNNDENDCDREIIGTTWEEFRNKWNCEPMDV